MTEVTRAEYCAIACADMFADAGEIFACPMATLPLIGARLAKLTTEPDLLITDGEALILADAPAIGATAPVEGYIPFSKVFDVVASGRRHVVMGANQIDKHGNQNLSAFGPLDKPTRQMFGAARRARQHHQPRHQLLGGQALHPRVRREGRRGVAASATTRWTRRTRRSAS